MENSQKSFVTEADVLHRALFGRACPAEVKDLYIVANTELADTWSFAPNDTVWLRKVVKLNICLPELAWLAKHRKPHPRDILWVKMHALLYITELSGLTWAARGKKSQAKWLGLGWELFFKPLRLAVASLRLVTNV
jgi:hypothetical protein